MQLAKTEGSGYLRSSSVDSDMHVDLSPWPKSLIHSQARGAKPCVGQETTNSQSDACQTSLSINDFVFPKSRGLGVFHFQEAGKKNGKNGREAKLPSYFLKVTHASVW